MRGDGRQLGVGTHGAVVVWDLLDARPAVILRDLPGPVHALAYSRDGKRLAVGAGLPARTGSVRVYTVPDGTLLHDFEGHDDVVSGLAFRPDGGQLASASLDQTVRLWDLIEGTPAGVFKGHSDFVYDVAYTPDGRSLLSASKDRSIKRIDLATLKEQRTYSDHDEDVLAVAFQPGGAKFVTAGDEPQLRWWTPDGEKPSTKVGGHGGPVHQLSFSGDGRRLISAGGDSSVRLWDGSSGAFLRTLPGPSEWQYAAALSGDGRLAAAGGWDGLVRVWDAEKGKLLATLIQPPATDASEPGWLAMAPAGHLTASPDLLALVRWSVGGSEVPHDRAVALFVDPEQRRPLAPRGAGSRDLVRAKELRSAGRRLTSLHSRSPPMSLARPVLPALIWAVLVPSAWAQTSYPMLGRVEPTALQRGREAEITISGKGSFAGAWQLLCEGPGLSGEVLDAKEAPGASTAKDKGEAGGVGQGAAVGRRRRPARAPRDPGRHAAGGLVGRPGRGRRRPRRRRGRRQGERHGRPVRSRSRCRASSRGRSASSRTWTGTRSGQRPASG